MWKTFLLSLVLPFAAALGFAGYHHGEAVLIALGLGPGDPLSNKKLDDCEEALDSASKKTKERGKPAPPLLDCVLLMQDQKPVANPSESGFTATLLRPASEYAQALNEVCLLFGAYNDPRGGTVGVSDPEYKKILEDRQQVRDLEEEIERLFTDKASDTVLRDKINKYKELRGKDLAMLRKFEGRLDERKITGLPELPARVDEVFSADPRPPAPVIASLEDVLKKLEDHQDKYGKNSPQGEWAEVRLQKWRKTYELLNLYKQNAKLSTPQALKTQVAAYAKLANKGGDKKFDEWLGKAVTHLCESYLDREFPLDKQVTVVHGDARLTVDREKVTAVLDGEVEVKLDDTRNEFTLKGKVRHVYVGDTLRKKAFLEPTPRSAAAHAYNVQRNKINNWTADSVKALLTETEAYKDELTRVRGRAKALQEAMEQYPGLFGGQ
jgi:hypothetical protein